jgi:hypothetical protein
MEIFIKLAPRGYNRLREGIHPASAAQDALNRATPIDHSVDGVQFAGYTIPCSAEQARALLEVARHSCPEIIPDIEEAIRRALSPADGA